MIARIHHRGMWQIAYKATDVLFPDGKRRTVKLSGEADSFFTMPAWVSYRGTTVSGFIMTNSGGDIEFIPTGKHKDIFNS